MDIVPFPIHILIHFILAILIGLLIGLHFKKVWLGILTGFLGGFLIDLDHVLEYFLFFGPSFNLSYFFDGRQFLLSNKIYLWFHAWEYIPLLLLAALIFKKSRLAKTIFITLAFASGVHLLTDTLVNLCSVRNYSLLYRARGNFAVERILSPLDYEEHLEARRELGL